MKKVIVSKKFISIVDDEDFEGVRRFKWQAIKKKSGVIYAQTRWHIKMENGKQLLGNALLHRFILNAPKGKQVDHIDGNGLNNRKENLRLCDNSQNHANMKKRRNTSSKYKGVCLLKDGKWSASIMKNDKSVHLGRFFTEEDAARAYNKSAKKLFGEFACLNKGC